MLPFIWKMQWWQDGMAGAWPSLLCYILGVAGFYRLAPHARPPPGAFAATAFYGLNANLLYLATTAMTEPLFLALLVWIVLLTLECVERLEAGRAVTAGVRMLLLGWLILCAVMTRYDGWILGAVVWLVVAVKLWQARAIRRRMLPVFAAFTLLTVAGPIAWLTYEHVYSHDWLDFMRGPYSAREIDRKTSPPGARKYFGWHDPAWSLMLYARTAQVDAAWWETGWLVMLAALAGTWAVLRERVRWSVLLLWLPLPFYVYSIAYGSVPIFIPQIYPHSFYNSRYGMELLPAFSLFGGVSVAWFARWLKPRQPLVVRLMQPVALMLCVLNTIFMVRATPLVLKEAMVNSVGRIALETSLAEQLALIPPGTPIMIDSSKYVGALQRLGIPLRQTINPADYYKGLTLPADKAGYVIAGVGDQVDQAVAASHAEGLTELTILCASKESCVRVYRSDRFFGKETR